MMKILLFICCISLFISSSLFAQRDISNILPRGVYASATKVTTYNDAYLKNHKEALEKFDAPPTLGMIEIPVKIHIVRGSSSDDKVDIKSVLQAFDDLNEYFMINYTRFVPLGDFNYIRNEAYYNFDKTEEEDLCGEYDEKSVLNLYILGDITVDGQKYCGYTLLPEEAKFQKDRVFIAADCLGNGVSLTRQMGHYLTLYPTHGTDLSNTGEFVNGDNCKTEGDEICDTPADPQLKISDVDERCGYVGKSKDNSGRKRYYKPDTRNLMSDNPRLYCCNSFTKGQYRRMLYAALNIRNYLEFPKSGYSKKQLRQLAEEKGIEGEVNIFMGNRALKATLDGNLYQNKTNVYTEGDIFKIGVTNYKKGYIYVLEGDREKGIYVKYPDFDKGDKVFSTGEEKMTVVVGPLKVDELVGPSGLNHIVVLFSRKPLKIKDLVKQMNDIDLDLDVIQRMYRVIGSDIIPTQYLEYNEGNQKVKGIAVDKFIAPIIVEYKQK